MSLVRWAPFTEVDGLTPIARDPFFRRLFGILDEVEPGLGPRAGLPALDLVEEKDRLVVRLELPGVDPKDVQVNLQDDILTVEGERKAESFDDSKGRYLKREQLYGSFHRTLQLPFHVRGDQVKAEMRHGVMTITLPKAEEHVGRQIPIQVEK
jgi:HSP20 family protein